jgi:hypothetical protein
MISVTRGTFLRICSGAAVIFGAILVGTAYGQSFPTTGSQYIWKVGNGTYSDWATNYSFNNGNPTSAPNAARDVIFGWEGTPDTGVVSLDPSVTGTGSTFPSNGSARSFNVYTGNYTFNFNGSTATTWNRIWRFGNGENGTPAVHFTDTTNVSQTIQFTNLVIGDNGSSNNIFGGPNSTITFGSTVTYSLSTTGTLTVGSTQGGGGNEFNVGSGQNFSRGAIVVSAGDGNKIVVEEGGTLSTSAATTIGAEAALVVEGVGSTFNKTGAAEFLISGDVLVSEQGSLNSSSKVNIASGGRLMVDGGTFAQTAGGFELAGSIEIINGGSFETTSSFLVTGSAAQVTAQEQVVVGFLDMNEDSSGNTISQLTIQGGGELYAQGQWNIGRGVAQGYSAGETLVEALEGSALRVDQLSLTNNNSAAESRNYIPIQGKIILGSGGFRVTGGDTDTTNARVGDGTHLVLDGGTYGLGFGTNAEGGRLIVESGGILSGTGTLLAQLTAEGGHVQVGNGSEAGILIVGTAVSSLVATDASFGFTLYDEFGTGDQIQLMSDASWNGTQTLTANLEADASLLDAEFTTYQLFKDASGDPLSVGTNWNYDFSQSSPLLAKAGLAWDTRDFASTGTLKLAGVAHLVFTPEAGETLGHEDTLGILNDSSDTTAQVLEARTSNEGWEVTGLPDETTIAANGGSATATAQFITQNALNGTHTGILTVQVDHYTSFADPGVHDVVTHTWGLSETVSGQVAVFDGSGKSETFRAHLDAGSSYAGYGLTSEGGTIATFMGGQASTGVILQMSFEDSGAIDFGPEGPQFLSDVVNVGILDGGTLEPTITDSYVLDIAFTGLLEVPSSLWLGYNNGVLGDLTDWSNLVSGNYFGGSYSAYVDGGGLPELGAWGYDDEAGSVWAVVDQSGSYAAFSAGAVPEPSRMLLVVFGAMVMIFRRKRG